MSTSNCTDFVTAVQYAELEARVEYLQESLNNHLMQNAFYAHELVLGEGVKIDTFLTDDPQTPGAKILATSIDVAGNQDVSYLWMPPPDLPVEIELDVVDLEIEKTLFINLTVGNNTNYAYVDLPVYPVTVDTFNTNDGTELVIQVGNERAQTTLPSLVESEINVATNYFDDGTLIVYVSYGESFDRDEVNISPQIIRRGNGNTTYIEDSEMACQEIADALTVELGEILAAIAAVQAQVTQVESQINQVKDVVTVEVEGQALTKFDCPKTDSNGGEETDAYDFENYKLPTLSALHEQLSWINQNQLAMFERICEGGGVLALPAWWQTRLNAAVPQIACVFRKADSSVYHTISIPHPANTSKPTELLLPAYTKGSWQGMIICKDNSKFIINCVNKSEAERMCAIAVQLIDSEFLELPPRIYVGERKGQAVGIDPMLPTSIEYFESGQQNTIPNWRVRVRELS